MWSEDMNAGISPSVEVVSKIADALEVSLDYLPGKTALEIDKQALQRLEDISKLSPENKIFVLNLIDMALRDIGAKKTYAKWSFHIKNCRCFNWSRSLRGRLPSLRTISE